MEYTVNELAKISGVSVRTLHYYDQIDLLSPLRIEKNGYRIYGTEEVDRLQQILFYRELGMPLKAIRDILAVSDLDKKEKLKEQLSALLERKKQLEALIKNMEKTICSLDGELTMSDMEKFEGFKKKMIKNNEAAYGKELRKRYGDEAVDASNAKVAGMSAAQWENAKQLEALITQTLADAYKTGDPAGEIAQKLCDLHRQWLCMFWKDGAYSKEAHKALADGYVADERFTAYYDKIAPGCTKFLRDAIYVYCS